MNDLSIIGAGYEEALVERTSVPRRSMQSCHCRAARSSVAGFSLLEVLVVLVIVLVIAALAIPQFNQMVNQYTVSSAAHAVAGMINEAKIRAGSDYTLARLNCTDRTASASASCQVEICTTKGATPGACTTWTLERDAQPLANPLTFQFGTITAVPADSAQTAPTESLQIYFNSRGIPIDVSGASPVPTGAYAIYLRDSRSTADTGTYAVVVQLSGRTSLYSYQGTSWVQQ